MDPATKRQLRMLLSDPIELGVHLAGPKLLARSEQAAVGLRAVYGHTWGLEIELRLARTTEPGLRPFAPDAEHGKRVIAVYPPPPQGRLPDTMPADPLEGFRFGLGWKPDAITLDTLPPGFREDPEADRRCWLLLHMGGGAGHLGTDWAVRVWPYPADGIVWLGWAWPELALPPSETMIGVPHLEDVLDDVVTLRARPDESGFPQDVRDRAARIRE